MPGLAPDVRFVIGIPTVARPYDYLAATVDSLISQIPLADRAQVEIVLFNAELPPERHATAAALSGSCRSLIDSGFLTILTNPEGHPQLAGRFSGLREDRSAYAPWAAKQVLDSVSLMSFCAARGTYYLHLEDDVIAADGFWSTFTKWFEAGFHRRRDWLTLALYSPYPFADQQRYPLEAFAGAIGLLFRCEDLPRLASYLAERFDRAPLDWLIRDFISERGGKVYVHAPPLFQHVGLISSLEGKVQVSDAPSFEEVAEGRRRRFVRDLQTLLRHRPAGTLPFVRHRVSRWIRRRFRDGSE